MLGYSLDEIKTLGLEEIHPEEDLPYVMDQFEKQRRKEISIARDIPLKKKDGNVIYVDINSVPITLDEKTYMLGMFRDITKRKKAEEESKLSASRLEALLELNQMTDRPIYELTNFVLEEAIRLTGSQIGYFAFMNEEETVLTMHSWSKSAMEECRIKDKPITYPVKTTGLWGEAVRQRRPIITNDYSAPSQWKK